MTTPWWSAKWSGHPQAHRLRVHRRGTRSRHAVFLPAILQPLLEFPPAVRRAGAGDQRQRKGTETVPLVCYSLGNPAPVAGRSGVPEGRFDDPGDGRLGAAANGHAGGHRHASSQTEVVRELFRTADSMRRITRATSACEGAQPPVGRPCGTPESSGIKTQKPSNEKENQNHPSPRRCPRAPLGGAVSGHTQENV